MMDSDGASASRRHGLKTPASKVSTREIVVGPRGTATGWLGTVDRLSGPGVQPLQSRPDPARSDFRAPSSDPRAPRTPLLRPPRTAGRLAPTPGTCDPE